MTRIACAVAVLLGGCTLYWPGGGGDKICNGATETPPSQLERDPYTGQCDAVGGGYDCGPCAPCAEGASGTIDVNWASCSSPCLTMNESSCRLSAGCQAEYLDDPTALTQAFWGCYPVEPTSRVPSGSDCTKLSVEECTSDDECIAVYSGTGTATKFESCGPELSPPPPPPPPPACDTLTTEADCTARTDCEGVYTGYDCTCDLSGCTCQTEVYASCKAR